MFLFYFYKQRWNFWDTDELLYANEVLANFIYRVYDWLTDASNIIKLSMAAYSILQRRFYNLYSERFKANKKTLVTEWVTE